MTTKVSYDMIADGVKTAFARRNAIINGDMNVWQRGTSFTSHAGGYTADRWSYFKSGAMVHDLSRSTDVPTVAAAGRLFNYSLLVDCTTADAAIAASDQCFVFQKIEGYNWLPLAQRACTLSFWVKATKTGTYCVALLNSGEDRSYVAEYTVNASDTWEEKTVTVTASPSAGTWDYTNGTGVTVVFTLAAGTDHQGAANAWNSARDIATSNQVNGTDSTSNNFRITGVQLEAGSAATDFEYRAFQDELALCQRYFEKSYDLTTVPGTAVQEGAEIGRSSGTTVDHSIRFRVEKRAQPSTVFYNPISGAAGEWRDTSGGANFAMAAAIAGFGRLDAQGTIGGDQRQYMGHWTATAEL